MDAVFTHDSAWATAGIGKKNNNPSNLRCITTDNPYHGKCIPSAGNGSFEWFPDLQTGIYAAVDVYNRLYRGLPADKMTYKWARTQNGAYYNALRKCFL